MVEAIIENENLKCVACGYSRTEPHHIKSRGSGGSDEEFNVMALCRSCHIKVHATGMVRFAKVKSFGKGAKVRRWLEGNGWYLDEYSGKWLSERNFK